MNVCPTCTGQLTWVEKYSKWYCYSCKKYIEPQPTPGQVSAQPVAAIWAQNAYRIRKKVLAIANKYWIEDQRGKMLGFAKQKMFRLKEDIRVYTDEKMKSSGIGFGFLINSPIIILRLSILFLRIQCSSR